MLASHWLGRFQSSFVFPIVAFSLATLPLAARVAAGQKLAGSQPQRSSLQLHFEGEQPRPLAMVSGDFDRDGVADLVIAYAQGTGGTLQLLRGNPEALAPRSDASRRASPAPFLQEAKPMALASQPNLLLAADVNGDGRLDLVYATQGSALVQVELGDGKGGFQPNPISIPVPGGVTALAAYRPGAPLAGEALLIAYQSSKGALLSILADGATGFVTHTTYALPAAATAMTVANLDADLVPDTAILAGGRLLVLHGLNAIKGSGKLETLPFTGIESVVAGQFLFDRHIQMQLSVATSSGEVLILAHEGFDPRPYTPAEIAAARQAQQRDPGSPTLAQLAGNTGGAPWIQVESEPEVSSGAIGAGAHALLRARWSGSGQDDLLVLNPSHRAQTVIRHLGGTQSLGATKLPGLAAALPGQKRVSEAEIGSGMLVGALPMRLNADGRSGVVLLYSDRPSPEFAVPSAGNTFYVNATADNSGSSTDPDDGVRCSLGSREVCTLRDAIQFANEDASANIGGGESDTINLPAGTYPLTWQAGVFDFNANAFTHLEVLGPVTLVGAGTGATILNGESNDCVFTINPGPYGSVNPSGDSYVFDMTIENLTITGGKNQNNPVNSNTGLSNDVGGGINWDADGAGNLTLTNVNVTGNTILYGAGGGIWTENSVGGGQGTLTLTGGSVSSNSTSETGGGVYVATPPAALAATNTVFNANLANPNVNSSDPGAFGDAGGLYFTNRSMSPATPQSVLNGVAITSNAAVEQGGGIETYSGILLENSVVSENSTDDRGGGFYTEIGDPEVAPTITSSNILENSAGNGGGGMYVGNENPSSGISLVIDLSRIFGNTAGSGTNGLATDSPGKATATHNWWGCNAGPNSGGCQSAGGGATTNPWAQFLFVANSPTAINTGGSVSYTVSLDTDSNGNAIAGAFPAVSDTYNNIMDDIVFTLQPQLGIAPANEAFNADGIASLTQTYDTAGTGTISAAFDSQTDTIHLDVSQTATSLAFTSPGYTYGQPGLLTVTLNPSNATGITASDFSVTVDGASSLDGSPFGVALISGTEYQITGPLNLVSPGGHTLQVNFNGPSQYAPATGGTTFSVAKGSASVSGILSPASPIQGVGGSAKVTVTAAGSGAAPTGMVSYQIDSGAASSVSLVGESATIPIPALLKPGSHTLALTYSGDPNHNGAFIASTFTVLGQSESTFASLTPNSTVADVFGFGFTPPSGQLAVYDTLGNSVVAGPVTLNVAAATTALTAQATTSTGSNSLPDWTTVGDVNGDGIPDLVTSMYGTDSLNVQMGKGDGTFGPATPVLIEASFGPAENHLVSLRGNGTLDLIVGSFNTNQIAVLLGNGDGTFQSPVFYTVGSATGTPTSLTTGDFNHDGNADVAVAVTGDDIVTIFSGDGGGGLTLSGGPIVPVGHDPQAIRAGDFNGDGYSDLAVANYRDGTVTTLLNEQNGNFSASTLATGSGAHSGPQALAITGSGNGLLLAVANYLDNTVSVFPSRGDGTFGPQTNVATGKGPDDVAFADFNGDGTPDLAVANYSGDSVSLILGSDGGNYAAQTQFPVGKQPYSVAIGDLNLDGTPDIVVPNCFSSSTGVLLSGTEIVTNFGALAVPAGQTVVAFYVPDGASAYATSASAAIPFP